MISSPETFRQCLTRQQVRLKWPDVTACDATYIIAGVHGFSTVGYSNDLCRRGWTSDALIYD